MASLSSMSEISHAYHWLRKTLRSQLIIELTASFGLFSKNQIYYVNYEGAPGRPTACTIPGSGGDMFMIIETSIAVALLNIPFGLWRVSVPKYSLPWFAAIHIPIPFVVTMRLMLHIGFGFATYPCYISAYFLGQYLGGKLKRS
jgi:hypothetical protein